MIPSQKHENDEYEEPRQADCFKELLEAFCLPKPSRTDVVVQATLWVWTTCLVAYPDPTEHKAEQHPVPREEGSRSKENRHLLREHPLMNGMPSHTTRP